MTTKAQVLAKLRRIALAPILLCGCAGAVPGVDAGYDAPIELPDAGLEPDTGPDGGEGLCAVITSAFLGTPPLPSACLPRCTAATRDAYAACDTIQCQEDAQQADPTPAVRMRTPYGIFEFACGASQTTYPCTVWQTWSCYEQHCVRDYAAYMDCLRTGSACTAE